MTSNRESGNSGSTPPPEEDLQEILGYLNFSGGKPDSGFARSWNLWQEAFGLSLSPDEMRDSLFDGLKTLKTTSATFAESTQAESVIRLVFDKCLPAYRRHHSDLLFHLTDDDFQQPYFLAKVFAAVLVQGPPWDEEERIVNGALDQLNDFLGYRPLAVLENDRHTEPYEHERCAPIPVYFHGAGAAAGRYRSLIERAIAFFSETPSDILAETQFDLSRMDELCLDPRAHDQTHPVNRRTSYMFGEWDPHQIDSKGYYRRFVIRKVILDAMLQWMSEHEELDLTERLYDASAVLCGTILMAATISGSGPGVYDSSVTLTSLLPTIARRRDSFYERLLDEAKGKRAKRLNKIAELTQQPFGHVRQYLNIYLATYGAKQVQYRHLAQLYARMGYSEASRRQALVIPSASARIECEIAWRLTATHAHLDSGELDQATLRLGEVEDLLHRGIRCGALIDPWNFLGFQGYFPLFSSREDTVPDHRAVGLLDLVEGTFRTYSRALGEASALGNKEQATALSSAFQGLAERWDRYATGVVSDLPEISGRDNWESAVHVSQALSQWRAAGEEAGDISFWREHVDRFDTAKAYAMVVDMLLEKKDHVAAMGLLMQWLSQADDVGFESEPHSMHSLLERWMDVVGTQGDSEQHQQQMWHSIRRMFDYLEANAGAYWSMPRLEEIIDDAPSIPEEPLDSSQESEGLFSDDWSDDDETLFDAAYDDVIYRDSASDGNLGDTLDDGYTLGNTEFEAIARDLEPRIEFQVTLAKLWQQAASAILSTRISRSDQPLPAASDSGALSQEQAEVILAWCDQIRRQQLAGYRLLKALWAYEIEVPSAESESTLEYDLQLQIKFHLLNSLTLTQIGLGAAELSLLCCLSRSQILERVGANERGITENCQAILLRDTKAVEKVLPRLCRRLSKKPLLYVPFENGGRPSEILAVRRLHNLLQFFLSELPQLGLLRQTWHVLQTAYRMEKGSRPHGRSVTEFDRLFQSALRSSLESVIRCSRRWKSGRFTEGELVEVLDELVDHYGEIWVEHSATMRLSSAEGLIADEIWNDVTHFVSTYGSELLHNQILTPLGNIRTILHNGVDWFLDQLNEEQDPLDSLQLLEDMKSGVIEREFVIDVLELIFSTIVDKYERYLEYNSTTTQSDYGEKLCCLLDFLRLEAQYERDEWNVMPLRLAHQILCETGHHVAARAWEELLRDRTADSAEEILKSLSELELKYGMQLPALKDHLSERFVRPMSVDRMLALVPAVVDDARSGESSGEVFAELQSEIEDYLANTVGSGIDVPDWLRSLEYRVVEVVSEREMLHRSSDETSDGLPQVHVNLRELRHQLKHWTEPLA